MNRSVAADLSISTFLPCLPVLCRSFVGIVLDLYWTKQTLKKTLKTYHFKVMVEISALDVVVSRNSENLDVLFVVDFDSLSELCSVLFKCHLIASNLYREPEL